MNDATATSTTRLLRLLLPIVYQCLQEKKARVRAAANRALELQGRPGSVVPPHLVKRLLSLADAYDAALDLMQQKDLSSRLCDALGNVRVCERVAAAEQRRLSAAIAAATATADRERLV